VENVGGSVGGGPGSLHRDGLWARAANLLLAGWLMVSAFALRPGHTGRVNALLMGYLVFVFALVATSVDGVRLLNTLLGLWLLTSAWILPMTDGMRWSTGLVGAAVVTLSLVSKAGRFAPAQLTHRDDAQAR
jgi:uncharacterized membrane protein